MSTVPSYNLTWHEGEDGSVQLTYKESVDGAAATPVDLSTNYAVRMDIRNAAKDLLYTFNSDEIVDTDPTEVGDQSDTTYEINTLGVDGTIIITVPRSASLPNGSLAGEVGNTLNYDVFLRNTVSNTQRKILKGTITIQESTTKWI